jgi:hypothetical protein
VKWKVESGCGQRSRVWTLVGGVKDGRRESEFFFFRSAALFVSFCRGELGRRSGGFRWRREVDETAYDFRGKRGGERVGLI